MCSSWGSETIQAQRMLRLLSESVARAGRAVFRFELSCTGDSDGNCEEADAERWAEDVIAAQAELLRGASAEACHWLGLGVGANVCLAAAHRARPRPASLLLWEPVLREGDIAIGSRPVDLQAIGDDCFQLPSGTLEQNGFPLLPDLRRQIDALALERVQDGARPAAVVLTHRQDFSLPPGFELAPVESWMDSTLDESVTSHVVSRRILDALMSRIGRLP